VSIRQGVKALAERWVRSPRSAGQEDRDGTQQVVAAAKKHASEAFYGCDDPLEAAVFSALVEIARHRAEIAGSTGERGEEGDRVDP
jgi:hypothetical protein